MLHVSFLISFLVVEAASFTQEKQVC